MKAWIFRRYGGPEVLEWADLPDPVPGKGEIVVRVVAAALNPLDWKLRAGQFKVMTAGCRCAASATTMRAWWRRSGEAVTRLKPGDAVVGIVNPVESRNGTMAERVCATEALATVKPPSLSFADGASLPGAGITAVQALRDGGLAAGKRVLIVGAAGGVGSFAVQLARIAGAHVTAVASGDGQEFLWRRPRPTAPSTTGAARTGRRCRALRHGLRCSRHLHLSPRMLAAAEGGRRLGARSCRARSSSWSLETRPQAKERCLPVQERADVADLKRCSSGWPPRGALRSVVSAGRPCGGSAGSARAPCRQGATAARSSLRMYALVGELDRKVGAFLAPAAMLPRLRPGERHRDAAFVREPRHEDIS